MRERVSIQAANSFEK